MTRLDAALEVLWVSMAAGLSSAAGALPVVGPAELTAAAYRAVVGFSAGVMAIISVVGLAAPALAEGGVRALAMGLACGAGVMLAWDRLLAARVARRGAVGWTGSAAVRQALLLWGAVVLHNIPEGIAIGAAYSGSMPRQAAIVALSIGAHNVPEGLAVAAPLRAAGVGRWRSWAAAASTGLAEPLAAMLAFLVLTRMPWWLPVAEAAAGGAMLYVVGAELLPQSIGPGQSRWGTAGLAAGVVVAFLLDALAG